MTAGPFVDRQRAADLLERAGLDALVVAEPEGFQYLSGVSQGVAALFRRTGAGFAVLPADPALPVGVVVGDLFVEAARAKVPDARSHPLWMERADIFGIPGATIEARIAESWRREGRGSDFARPATFDLRLAIDGLRDVLADRGLASAHLGFDLDYVSASDAESLRAAFPPMRNGSPVLDRLRMVKTPGEIARLTLALDLSEAGLRTLIDGVRAGQGAADLHTLYRAGVEAEARRRGIPPPPSWDYVSIGPNPWSGGGRVEPGAVIKADVGCVVDGYSSDTSRNFVFGEPTADQLRLHRILEQAFAIGLTKIRPGVPLREVHRVTITALREEGLAGFARGHFGHGCGHSFFSEQWPFISADAETLFEPDMVMAFEVPIYIDGLGGFNLEDQLIVTPDGHRVMTTLPRELGVLGA